MFNRLKPTYLAFYLLLGVLSSCSQEEEPIPTIVELEPKPEAGFSFAIPDPKDPFTYKFTNGSKNFKEVRWNFADDSTSSEISPEHTFLKTGTFNVKMVVLNSENYWAQREETIKINPSSLINIKTEPSGDNKLKIGYETSMNVGSTQWFDGYGSSAGNISSEKDTEITFNDGEFRPVRLDVRTPKGSLASLNLLFAELGLIKDLTNVDNTFTISHENGGGPDGNEGSKKLIDNNITTKLFLGGVGGNLTFQFEYFVPQIINGYSMTSGNDANERDPKRWKVEGSQDGVNWTIVDERSNEQWASFRLTRVFTNNNATAYKFYKFSILELRSGSNFQMSEVRLLQIPR